MAAEMLWRASALVCVASGACHAAGSGFAAGGTDVSVETSTGSVASSTSTSTDDTTMTGMASTTATTDPDADTGPLFDLAGMPDIEPDPPVGAQIPATCDEAESGASAVGCRFFGVDLDQALEAEAEQYAIAVSNPQPEVDAEVVVERKVDGVWQQVAASAVSPLGLVVFPLPDLHHQGSGVMVGGAYRVTSSVPIVGYQFNPLAQGSFSTDATMLYPVTSWDSLNRAVHWGGGVGRGYLTVVAAWDDTTIRVIPTAATDAGDGVPAGTPGVPFEVTLQEGDIAEIMVTESNTALGGTRIESDSPARTIGVFSAHECAQIPHGADACDHIEEQLSGVRLWGQRFVASRMPVRETLGMPESTLWQVVASEDDTTVTFSSDWGIAGAPFGPQHLDAGGVLEFYVDGTDAHPGDFLVDADRPIAIANYMTGASLLRASDDGDPAMVQISPIEQWLPRYTLLVPSEWETDIFVITRENGIEVTVDDVPVNDDEFLPIGDGYEVARVVTTHGVHTLESSSNFMVTVVGYDSTDSYAYIGGTGTGVINPNPAG